MKRFFSILAILFAALSISAAPELKVKSGKWTSLKSEDAKVCVEFDYSKARWEEGQSYETFCGDTYEPRVSASVETFIYAFNENTIGLKLSQDEKDAQYKFVFHIRNIERKMSGFGWGRFFIRVYGEIEIIDIASNTTICTIMVNGHAGDADYIPEDRLAKCFRALAEQLIKLKK